MDDRKLPLTRRQLQTLALIGMLSPTLRLLPAYCAQLAGSALWLCPVVALPAILLMSWIMTQFLKNRRSGEGPGAMLMRALGKTSGAVVLVILSLWLVFYAGFTLRSGADRFVSTVYPESRPEPFVIATLLMGLVAALGKTRALARASEVFRPVILVTLLMITFFAFFKSGITNLLPVTVHDTVPVLKGSLPVIEVVSFALFLCSGVEGAAPIEEGRGRSFGVWSLAVCLLLAPVISAPVAKFGHELVSLMPHPFFVLARNTQVLGMFEQMEALIAALWVLPDFILTAMSLTLSSYGLRLALGYPRPATPPKALDLHHGRWFIWLCAIAAGAIGLFIGNTAPRLDFLSEQVIPLVNLALCYLILPAVLAIGKLRHKI